MPMKKLATIKALLLLLIGIISPASDGNNNRAGEFNSAKTAEKRPLCRLPEYFASFGGSVSVVETRTDKVTYRSLAPDVRLTAVIKNPTFVAQDLDLEFRIEEPLTQATIAGKKAAISLPPKIVDSASVSLSINVPKMTGLLAKVIVRDKNGNVLDVGMRPFDVTDDMRRNFRFAGAAFFTARSPNRMNPTFTPEDEAELVYQGFQNCADAFTREYRGHFTPWQEHGNRWRFGIYGKMGATVFDSKTKELCKAMLERGIMPEMWMETRRYDSDFMDARHPWIKRLADGSPDFHESWSAFYMNIDPGFYHPLSPEEEAMMGSYSHGAVNWIDYLTQELILACKRYGFRSFWADNHTTKYKDSFATLIEQVNQELGYKMFIKSNHNDKIQDDGFTDVYWIETAEPLKESLPEQLTKIRSVMKLKRTKGATVMWANPHNGGPLEPYSDDYLSPDIVNNDPAMTHMYRQYLFESIAMDPDLVHIQNTPRLWSERFSEHTEAFEKHCKTWGFQTLFVHLFNSPDIIVARDSSEIVSAEGQEATYDDALQAGKLHIRVTERPELHQTMIHIFNYIGTDITNLIKRPRPAKQDAVKLKVKRRGEAKDVTVYAISPDNDDVDTVIMPKASRLEDSIEFTVPVDTYTLVVIQQQLNRN